MPLDELSEGRNGWSSHLKCIGEGGVNPKGWLLILENGFGAWTQDDGVNQESPAEVIPMM